jgi:hypothetical protein
MYLLEVLRELTCFSFAKSDFSGLSEALYGTALL